ncbi:prolyl endopeptidase-like isoform X2 [Crotalus tigris]|uniref:prolyl endopeptidase-like isoform X2 n=1 Tax=Crotalus tigris TaxID=88082 RepID=UPI00192F127B|nr:prolyl endopeptidase-like isoform X2 [Crotalus tigris]
MYSGIKYFPSFLEGSIGHLMNCFKYSSTSSVRFYSQTKQQVFFFTTCFRNVCIVPYSQGSIQSWRFFSCKDLLKSEQKNWRVCSANYTDLRERIKQKLEKHYDNHSLELNSLMIKFGDYIYFEENGCIFRSKLGEVEEENYEALLSTEALPFENSFIQQIRISPDHGYMATGIKSASSEECACIIVKLHPISKVECIIPNAFSFEWATHDILFYTIQKNLQCHSVYLSDFNKKHSGLVYTESDARYFVDLYRTKDKHFITINSNSKTTSEVWLVDCRRPFKSPVLVQKRTQNIIYHVEHRNNELYILTTYGNPVVYKLMKAPVGSCSLENWQPIYTVHENAKLIDLDMFRDHCIIFLKLGGELYLDIISLVSNTVENVKDETWVPITVFYKNNSTQLHKMPLLVHVYGAYGIDLNMTFKAENLMLIKDGWILAFCHVRGGGELGLRWHKDGCMMKKHNGIQDLQACIKLLHELGYSQPMQTALMSTSAGGILAGAICNIAPHLIRAVVLQAPFLDILNTMLDPYLPLTIEEQEEWGDPVGDEACKEYIKSYCPYQNIKPQNYPSLFITASEKDQRVPMAGLLRYINKLRKALQDHAETNNSDYKGTQMSNIILDVQPGGNHCSPTYEDSLKQVATQLAFLYSELGLDKQE